MVIDGMIARVREYIRVLSKEDDETEGRIRNKGRNVQNLATSFKTKSVIITQNHDHPRNDLMTSSTPASQQATPETRAASRWLFKLSNKISHKVVEQETGESRAEAKIDNCRIRTCAPYGIGS